MDSREVFVGCRALDIITTKIALSRGATELNPFGFTPILIGLNVALSIYVWGAWPSMSAPRTEAEADTQGMRVMANILSCVPVINNVSVIRGGA